jgi:hypothetical protein
VSPAEVVANTPVDLTDDQLAAWAAGYLVGHDRGHAEGRAEGYAAYDRQILAGLVRMLGGPEAVDFTDAVQRHLRAVDQRAARQHHDADRRRVVRRAA